MILKSLELQGFKSFPDKTTLTFDRGTTVVVGPNGSGKSNLSDAMKWVLGEVSTKNLRGSRMEDVIFGGSDTRRQMGYAEVSVTFDNTVGDTRLVTDYDEVTVTRRYYRSGESEYFINAKPVRLRDIHELFLNTGVGRDGYSIIGQGKIAEIISRKSEERRSVFEEAAGISKYKYKKEESEKKLAAVEDNLLRVSDIVRELESRVGPLEKESARARTYLDLYGRKKEAEVSLWLYDMQALKTSIRELSDACRLSKNDYERACDRLGELENESEALYLRSQENNARTEELNGRLSALSETRMQLESACGVLENELSHIAKQRSDDRAALDGRAEEIRTTGETLVLRRTALSEARDAKEAADAVCSSDRETEERADRSLDEAYAHLSSLHEEIAEAARAAGDLKAELSALSSTKNAEAGKRAEIEESKKKYEENIRILEDRLRKAADTADAYQTRSADYARQKAAAKDALAAIQTEKRQIEEQQNSLFLDYSAKKNRIDALSRMEELFEGYSRAVRFLMSDYEKGKLPGAVLYGPLSKLITVEPRYAAAIETALGANIQNIPVKDEASAKAAILHLKKNNAGRATFYPLTTMRASDFSYPIETAQKQKGFLGIAASLVRCDAQFDTVIRSLLGRVLICDTIDHAADLARAYDYRVRIVTLDGQQINAGGSFTGGSLRHDSGMLTRAVEIEGLRGSCAELSKQIDACKDRLQALDREAKVHTDQMETIRVNAAMIATLSQAEETQKKVIETQLSGDREMLASLEEEEARLSQAGDVFAEEHNRLQKLYDDTLAREEALSKERAEAEAQRESCSRELTAVRRTLSSHEVRAAEAAKDIAAAEGALAKTEEQLAALRASSDQLKEELQTLTEKQTENERLLKENRKTIAAQKQEAAEAEQQKEALHASSLAGEQKTAVLRGKIKEQTHTKELLFQTYTKAENRHASALAEQDKMVDTLWNEYELTYSSAALLGYPAVTADNRVKVSAAVSTLRAEIKALGPVSVASIDEYKEVKERYDFMTAQIDDLTASRADLSGIICRLEEEMRVRFADAMRDINHHFRIVFRELFGGGHAELILTEPDNILESGIEINVAPPGKIIKNLMLLSGGEQAFVAIALYFALLKVNPSPFCILDEIEAALDDVNVDKFAEYLRRSARNTQFIVITHRRGTMEIADRLYGVTMVDRGVSTVLSIDAKEVGAYTDD